MRVARPPARALVTEADVPGERSVVIGRGQALNFEQVTPLVSPDVNMPVFD